MINESNLTSELYTIPLQDKSYLIYAPLKKAAFISNAEVVNYLADLKEQKSIKNGAEYDDLHQFLEHVNIIDDREEKLPITTFENDPQPTTVSLFMTTACNLRCTYCYASAGDTPLRNMSIEVAKKGIDFVLKNAILKEEKKIEIAFHGGGEPTVNWAVMKNALAYAKSEASKHGVTVRSGLASNGVLKNYQIDWIIENLDSVSISFDGLPQIHDKYRPTVGGKPSSKKVIHTMKRFDEVKYAYGIRVTVIKEEIPNLVQSIEFICNQFNPISIQVEPAYQMGRWREAPSADTEDFIKAYRKAQVTARDRKKDISFSGARAGMLSNHFCGVTQDNFCLSPDGNVSGCYEVFSETEEHADTFFYGKPVLGQNDYFFDLPVLNNLRQQAVQHRSYCQGCFAKWSCGGDCYHKSITVNGSKEFQGTDRCHIIRELTKDQILDNIIQNGGYYWKDTQNVNAKSKGKELLI